MIFPALNFLVREFSGHIQSKAEPDSEEAADTLGVLGNAALLFDSEGIATIKDKVVFTLVNLEEDRGSRSPLNLVKRAGKTVTELPAIHLNLYVLAAATHSKYDEGLTALGQLLTYFQHNKRFTTASHPELDPSINELSVELYTMNFEQVNHLWSTLGGKYMPSSLYKVRQVRLKEDIHYGEVGRIEEVVISPELLRPQISGER